MKPKLTFVFHHTNPTQWKDGLWAALNLLEADFEIEKINLAEGREVPPDNEYILAWGAFNSPAEKAVRTPEVRAQVKALQIGGTAQPPSTIMAWDVVFPETDWHLNQIAIAPHSPFTKVRTKLVKAFGVNTDVYYGDGSGFMGTERVWDWISVGAFASWKNYPKLLSKSGLKLAVGEIQEGNRRESEDIIRILMSSGIMVSPFVSPKTLSEFYRRSINCYIPAGLHGGGERAVLEARSCGCTVEVSPTNLKLAELLTGPIPSHHDFASALKKGLLG